jgi:hypothetical protein
MDCCHGILIVSCQKMTSLSQGRLEATPFRSVFVREPLVSKEWQWKCVIGNSWLAVRVTRCSSLTTSSNGFREKVYSLWYSQAHLSLHICKYNYLTFSKSYVPNFIRMFVRDITKHSSIKTFYVFVVWISSWPCQKWGVSILIDFPMRSRRHCDRFNRSIIRYCHLSAIHGYYCGVRPQPTHLQLHTWSS